MASSPDGDSHVFEVEFHLTDSSYPFIAASEANNCRVELAEMVPRPDDRYAEFFNVTGAEPSRLGTIAADHEGVDVTLLRGYENGGLFEFLVSDNCPALELAERGALPRHVEGRNGAGRIVAEIPSQYDPPAVVDAFLEDHPDAQIATKREKDAVAPLLSESAFRQALDAHLTDRQREVLRAAYEAGYYDWPRASTGEAVAEELDITSATFSEHIHAAERNLLTALFDGPGPAHVE